MHPGSGFLTDRWRQPQHPDDNREHTHDEGHCDHAGPHPSTLTSSRDIVVGPGEPSGEEGTAQSDDEAGDGSADHRPADSQASHGSGRNGRGAGTSRHLIGSRPPVTGLGLLRGCRLGSPRVVRLSCGGPRGTNRCQRRVNPGHRPRRHQGRRVRPRLDPVQPPLVLAEYPITHGSLISHRHRVDNDQVLRVGRHFVTSSDRGTVATTVAARIRRQSQSPA